MVHSNFIILLKFSRNFEKLSTLKFCFLLQFSLILMRNLTIYTEMSGFKDYAWQLKM